jgi:hypothetical protein
MDALTDDEAGINLQDRLESRRHHDDHGYILSSDWPVSHLRAGHLQHPIIHFVLRHASQHLGRQSQSFILSWKISGFVEPASNTRSASRLGCP